MQTPNARKSILVVDGDETVRTDLKYWLLQGGHEPVLARGAEVAMQLLERGGIDLVLSDATLHDMDGVLFLKEVKRRFNLPSILVSADRSRIIGQARSAGADLHLEKPFSRDSLHRAVDASFGGMPVPDAPGIESNFCRMPIEDFICGKEMRYDIYVRLSRSKFVKIAQGGANLRIEQIQSYKDKGITHLYLLKEDYRDYLKFHVRLAQAVKGAGGLPPERKMRFFQQTSRLLLQTATAAGGSVDSELLEQSMDVVESAVAIIGENDVAFGLMEIMHEGRQDNLYAHSLAVSLYATLMATQLGWVAPATQFYVAAGALFHDVGKKEFPEELLRKPRALMNLAEIAMYETHPRRGADIIRSVPGVPEEVAWIIQQHHENDSGTGYPQRLKRSRIYPLAKLVAVADEFCECIQKEILPDRSTVQKVLHQMVSFSKDNLDPISMVALLEVFKVEVPPELRSVMSVSTAKKTA